MSVTSIGSGLGSTVSVRPTIRPGAAELVAARRTAPSAAKLTEDQRRGMVQFLQRSRALHRKLEEAIEITARSVFGRRDKTTTATVETGDLGLGTSAVDTADLPMAMTSQLGSVTADTIRLNNETFAIDPDTDSLNDVISAMNANSKFIVALNGSNEMELSRPGAGQRVRIQDDSAGFFGALGIAVQNYATGQTVVSDPLAPVSTDLDDATTRMDQIGAFSGVSAGTLTVLGEAIAIDPTTDSFADVVARIDAVDGASADYDSDSGVLTITADDGDLTLDSDTSGFLSAVGLTAGTTAAATRKVARQSNDRVFALLQETADLTNQLFRHHDGDAGAGSPLTNLRGRLAQALLAPFDSEEDDGQERKNTLGFHVDLRNLSADNVAPQGVWQMQAPELRDIADALLHDPAAARTFLLGTEEEAGLLTGLRDAIEETHEAVLKDIGPIGGLLSKLV